MRVQGSLTGIYGLPASGVQGLPLGRQPRVKSLRSSYTGVYLQITGEDGAGTPVLECKRQQRRSWQQRLRFASGFTSLLLLHNSRS
jgi:hypothetical protein